MIGHGFRLFAYKRHIEIWQWVGTKTCTIWQEHLSTQLDRSTYLPRSNHSLLSDKQTGPFYIEVNMAQSLISSDANGRPIHFANCLQESIFVLTIMMATAATVS
jgi:hypothetical protein